jgi:hypothetical protein
MGGADRGQSGGSTSPTRTKPNDAPRPSTAAQFADLLSRM